MPKFDVFISFSTADRKTVEGICGYLERYGYRCFVSYRDIPPGTIWSSNIPPAIKDSSLMVAVFSKDFNVSKETSRELDIASKNNIPILTFKVSDTVMSDSKEYYLSILNWIDAFPNPENYFGKLKESIEKLIGKPERGYLIDEEIRKQQEVEKEQKAREEREQLRRELEIERDRRRHEEKMRELSEQQRVWLEHKLEADRQSTANENNKYEKRKTPPPTPVPQWWEWVKRYIWLIVILLLLVVLGVVLLKGGMLPIRKTVAPVDTVAQLSVDGDTVPEALLHQLSSQEQHQTEQEQSVVQAVSPVEQKKEEPVQQSSSSVSVRQEKGNLLFTVNGVEFKMVKVEGGKFKMGTINYTSAWNEKTKQFEIKDTIFDLYKWDITVSDFYIGDVEVSNSLWNAVMGKSCRGGHNDHFWDTFPVDSVSWDDAQLFIKTLNEKTGKKFRLPTRDEWQYAARGGQKSQGYKYSGSNNIDEVAWYRENYKYVVHRSRGKKKNELGLYDMSGNVSEWIDRENSACGGTWYSYESDCTVLSCISLKSTTSYQGYGLRLVLDY